MEATKPALMTINQFIERYDTEGPFEIYDGEIVPLMPNVAGHGDIVFSLAFALRLFCEAHHLLGKIFTEHPFIVEFTSEWVKGSRAPDIMYFAVERWAAYVKSTPDWRRKPSIIIPDLVVEVLSPTDKAVDVKRKTEAYLKDGMRLIWLVDPWNKVVDVYHGGQITRLTEADTLSGADVIPGFELLLAELFADE